MPCALNKQRFCLGESPPVDAEKKEIAGHNKPVVEGRVLEILEG